MFSQSTALIPRKREKFAFYPVTFNYDPGSLARTFGSFCISLFFLLGPLSRTYAEDDFLAQIDGNTISVNEFIQGIGQIPPLLQATLTSEEVEEEHLTG